jgi:cytochrome c oxidase assembly factor 6
MVWGLEWVTGPAKPEVKPVREKSKDGGYVAPDRSARDLCYESRDLFYRCLDKHNILDATKDDELSRQKCPTENAEFERDCVFWEYAEVLTVWVQIKYFKEKRVMEYKRDQTYAQINKEDAEMAARSKAQRKEKGGIGGWF